MGDSATVGHTAAAVKPSTYGSTMEVVGKTMVVAQTTDVVVATVKTMDVVVPSVVAASFNNILPLRSTCPSFYPGEHHMCDNP